LIEILTGSTGNDNITISGTQLNQFTSLNLEGGVNTLNIISTSTGLNSLANGSVINISAISASAAGAAVTIDLSNQTEGFILTGSVNSDIITGSSGNDTITAGDGSDTVNGTNFTWFQSNTAAQASTLGGATGHLINITSQGEQTLADSLVTGNNVAWTGGGDSGTEGVFQWLDGPEAL